MTVTKKRMLNLFNIVYFLAKERKPLTDITKQCILTKKLSVEVGTNYHNYHNELSAKQFLHSTHVNLKNDTKQAISGCNFISILCDGSTDISVVEQEVGDIRYRHSDS